MPDTCSRSAGYCNLPDASSVGVSGSIFSPTPDLSNFTWPSSMLRAAWTGCLDRLYRTRIRAPIKAPPMILPTTMPPIAPPEIEDDDVEFCEVADEPVAGVAPVDTIWVEVT